MIATDFIQFGKIKPCRRIVEKASISTSWLPAHHQQRRGRHETVLHLHVHILGGRHMAWPPG